MDKKKKHYMFDPIPHWYCDDIVVRAAGVFMRYLHTRDFIDKQPLIMWLWWPNMICRNSRGHVVYCHNVNIILMYHPSLDVV